MKLQSDAHLMKFWTVFLPHSPSRTWLSYRTPHSSRLILRPQALILLFFSLPDIQCSGHQSSWPWSRQYTVCCQEGEQDHIGGFLDAVHYVFSELQQSSRIVLGREQSLSNGSTMRFLQRVFTSRVRVVKNHNFLPLSNWLTTLPPGLESLCQPLNAQPPLPRSETCSMGCPLISWTTSTYCSTNRSGYRASYRQGASGRPSKAASSTRVPLKVSRSCFSLRKQNATHLAAPLA